MRRIEHATVKIHPNLLLSCDTSVIHVFNCIQSIFDYYEQWEQQLIHVCHTDGSLEDLLELSLPVFKNPLWISCCSHCS